MNYSTTKKYMPIRQQLKITININSIIYQMNKQGRSTSQSRPRFRSTKYNTFLKRNKITYQPQESQIQNNKHGSTVTVERLGKLVDFNTKRKISLNSQDFYLKTFNSFMSTKHEKQNYEINETDVILTHYKSQFDEKESNFTLLDVISKPLSFVEGEISSVTKELKNENNKAEMLKHELNSLNFMINKQLDDIQKTTNNKIAQLRKLLKNSEIYENQRKLRNKKELKLIQKGHNMNKNKFQSLKQRSLEMQTLIFDCQPLQLQFHRYTDPSQTDGYL